MNGSFRCLLYTSNDLGGAGILDGHGNDGAKDDGDAHAAQRAAKTVADVIHGTGDAVTQGDTGTQRSNKPVSYTHLAAELAPYGIRVNGYIPGVIDTDMTHALTVSNGEAMKSAIAMQTFGEPMDVAWALAFLASDYARYITGTTLEISGGKMGRCV